MIIDIILFQIGAAPVIPDTTFDIRVLSLFPTHVATKKFGVNPSVQLSRKSLVVPVLTDTVLPLMLRKLPVPKAIARAPLSDKICEIKKAVSFEIALLPS